LKEEKIVKDRRAVKRPAGWALGVALTAIGLMYFLFPLIAVDPTTQIEIWLSDIKRSSDGLSVNFTVCFKNQGVWPISLTNMKWKVRIVAGPFSCECQEIPDRPLPERLALGPTATVRVPAFARYDAVTAFWICFERGYRRNERIGSIEGIIVSITGLVGFAYGGPSKPFAVEKDIWTT